jgi:hypothetical protein
VWFSDHFERFRGYRLDRADITIEMYERVKAGPMKREDQDKGRTAYQGYVPEKDRYLKVVVEPDGEEIVTAHWDRGFRRERKES